MRHDFSIPANLQASARNAFVAKALQLTGGPNSPAPPANRNLYGAPVAAGKADIFLVYRTVAVGEQRENPGQRAVTLPAELAIGTDYGLTVIDGASPKAERLAAFILSPDGQAALTKHGFAGTK